MKFFSWHEKLIKRIPAPFVAMTLAGKSLFIASLASHFRVMLEPMELLFLLIGTLLVGLGVTQLLTIWHRKQKAQYIHFFTPIFGFFFVLLVVGVQIRLPRVLLLLGFLMALPALYFLLRKQ